jgi:glycine/D-amino acid oxidase-like deaminating enzyme
VSPRSFWLEEALADDPGAPCPPLRGRVTADVCICGGGFAGLWTAYELTEREPSLEVVLIEADICGAGGSGANGGFFSSSWTDLASLCRIFGEEAGVRYATALGDEVAALGDWIARHEARIDFHHEGILYARAGDWQAVPDPETFRLLAAYGLSDRLREVDADEARRVADSPRFVGGVVTPDLATVQPAKLARELRRVLLERGVRIFENTPMVDLRTIDAALRGAPVSVETPAGHVVADQVVLTIGAWGVERPEYRRAFAVATDFMVVTEPIPRLIEEIGWTTHRGVADRREMLYYLRRTDDDRIAIGGGALGVVFGDRIRGRAVTSRRLAEVAAAGLGWLFPPLEGVRFTHAWSGPMDVTPPGLPFFHTWSQGNVHAGLGFSGHGLVPTRVGGKTLASLVLGADDEWSRLPVVGPPLVSVPPEPLRWPLVSAAAWAYERGDRAAQHGRRPGIVAQVASAAMDRYAVRAVKAGRHRLR